jgi:DNA-binding NarL/FixJ family response regulator
MSRSKSKSPPQRYLQPAPRALPALTSRERTALECVMRGLFDKLIGAEMGIGVRGVRRHLQALHSKYAVHSRLQLCAVFLGLHGITTDASPLPR